MLQRAFSIVVATAFGFTPASLMSQETDRSGKARDSNTPAPVADSAAPARIASEPAQPSASQKPAEASPVGGTTSRAIDESIRWRYQWHNGNWWYWTPRNEWLLWRGGRWVAPTVIPARDANAAGSQAPQSYRSVQVDPNGSVAAPTFQQTTGGYHTEPGYSNWHRGSGFPEFQQGTGGYHNEPGYSNMHRVPGPAIFQHGTPGYYDSRGNFYYADPRDQGYWRYYGFGGDFYSD